ncbi:roadblock/LC7 domain-containing protein [Thermovibrio sp.]
MDGLLKEIVEGAPEIESALVVDEEGIVVYRYDKEPTVDPEDLATHFVNPLNMISEFFRDSSNDEDDVNELITFTKRYLILSYKLVNGTYLIVIAKATPLYGRVRFKVRTKIPKLVKTL